MSTCQFAGKEYSEGATICSNNREYVCTDGQWSPTGAECETTEKVMQAGVHLIRTSQERITEGSCGGGLKESISYCDNTGASSVPKITINDPTITISWETSGGGVIRHTWLTGTGGNYYLQQGQNTVAPGTYSHQIDGYIVNNGYVKSRVCYK